jgi:hypothetical protein
VGRDAGEYVVEPLEWINLGQFARCHKAPQDSHRFATAIASQKNPVVPTDGDAAQRSFRVIVVDR